MICGRWIQTRKTLSIVSQHLCIRRARMFTWSETNPFTAHMPAHYYSACGSLVYRMRAVDQCAVANYSQHTSAGVPKKQRYLTFTGPILPFNNVNKTCFCERQSKRNIQFFFFFQFRATALIGNMFDSYSSKELGADCLFLAASSGES